MNVLVVGSMAFDSIETPHGRADRVLGGSAAYFALAAALFAPVRVVGVVGKDFPEEHLTALSRSGVDLQGLQRAEGKTFYWRGRYHEDLNVRDTLEVQLNVLQDFVPRIPAGYADTEYAFLGNIDPAIQLEVLSQLKQPRQVACDTMDHWIRENPGDLGKVLERIDALIVNDSEARLLSGRDNIIQAARAILKMGPPDAAHQARRVRRFPVLGFLVVRGAGLSAGRGPGPHRRRRLLCRRLHGLPGRRRDSR